MEFPNGATGFALIFNVELPEVVTGFGVKLAVTLEGTPEALSVTELLGPTATRDTVSVPLDFRFTVSVNVESEILKSAGTLTVMIALCVPLPVPVIVSA